MLILAIETATPAGSVALLEGQRLVASRYFDVGYQHSRRLCGEIEAVLKVADKEVGDLDGVAVSIGPGSFTGLRIGLSAAKGVCFAASLPLVTVPTLEALAAAIPYAARPVCPVLGARRGEVYTALFETTSGMPVLLEEAEVLTPEALAAKRGEDQILWVGDGVELCAEYLGDLPLVAPPLWARPEARLVGLLAGARLDAGAVADLAAVEPEYLRDPDYVRAKRKVSAGQ